MGSNPVIASYIFTEAYWGRSACSLVLVPGLRLGTCEALCSATNSIFDFRENCSVFVSYLYNGNNTKCCHRKYLQRYVHREFWNAAVMVVYNISSNNFKWQVPIIPLAIWFDNKCQCQSLHKLWCSYSGFASENRTWLRHEFPLWNNRSDISGIIQEWFWHWYYWKT